MAESNNSAAIAIIGMAGRFPGARRISEFWRNLSAGIEAISCFSEAELEAAGVSREIYIDPAYVAAKGIVAEVEMFDAAFFGFTPAEAALMDPQQRLFLECAWEALEDAGYDFASGGARTGIYAGSAMSTYLLFNLLSNPDLFETVNPLQVRIMNDKDFLTTLVSYKLNLKGPSVAVQTACSTSLVAVHLAAQALLDGECDLALAGGVAVSFPQKGGYMYAEGGIWSPDGHCRAFDAEAQGTVEGNGAGVVVLKRYEDAVADGDYIHALIRGSAINNDGSLKAGYTAPSLESQTQVVLEALAMSGVDAGTITYVEAHGSATPLGDPIEVQALTKAFRSQTEKKVFCALGSVKSSVGHLDNAAGMASLIKTVEALKHKVIPPTLHFRQPNPRMDLPNSPFYVNTSAIEWTTNGSPRRAGVSSLGIGGTNAHLIVEEAPEMQVREDSSASSYQLLALSAKTEAALDQATANLAQHLRDHPELNLADVGYTLQVGRRSFNHRRMFVSSDRTDALALLESPDPQRVLTATCDQTEPDVVMMFPGLGDHHVNMGAELYHEQPAFRKQVDYCAALLKPLIGLDLREVLYPEGTAAKKHGVKKQRDGFNLRKMLAHDESLTGPLSRTSIAQPAVFVIEYALARLLMSWGIRPQALIGYSIGEYVAACLAGVFSLDDALLLVARRAALIEQLPEGAMLAVPLAEDELIPHLTGGLSLCAANGAALSVAGGPHEAVRDLEQRLTAMGVACKWLRTSHAFHSQMMDSVVEPFRKQVSQVQLNPPQIPFIANVTGTWITAAEATDSNYWASHLRQTVRFSDGVQELIRKPKRAMLEVGPGQALKTLVRQHAETRSSQLILSSMIDRRDDESELEFILTSVGRLWLAGVKIDWQSFNAQQSRRRVPLPTYPFQRERYWIEPGRHQPGSPLSKSDVKKANLDEWFYAPVWKRARVRPPLIGSLNETRWLVFLDECDLGAQVVRRLAELDAVVISVKPGERFETIDGQNYTLNPAAREDYDALTRELRDTELLPTHVVHLWSVTPDIPNVYDIKGLDSLQENGFYSLLFLVQAFGEHEVNGPLQLAIVSNNLFDVTGEERCCAMKATVCGPAKVIPQEYPSMACRNIDVVLPDSNDGVSLSRFADQIVNELLSTTADHTIAYRGRHRWVRSFEATQLTARMPVLRDGGTYLITGADEEIGLMLAEDFARSAKAKLTLIAAPEFPARDKWETWLSAHDDQDEVSRKIRRLRALEIDFPESEILLLPADVASHAQMEAALSGTIQRFGTLNGVIHAASVQSPGIIQLKTPESAAGVLAPKTKGTLILASLVENIPLDFLALFSSTISIAGGFGQVDSCAANAFLDAFANQRSVKSGAFTVAINWSAFQWDQWMLPATTNPGLQEQLQQNLMRNGTSAGEGAQIFKRIIGDTLSQVIVCPQDLASLIEQTDNFTVTSFLEVTKTSTETHPRPALSTPYVEPGNEIEQTIASIWQESFGITQVGVEDNFFDLDGNSLLAIQIVTRLRRAFDIELPMTSLFDAPTVSKLARKVEELKSEPAPVSQLEKLLSEIEMLSADDARQKFAEEQ